jgi:Tol biopolymer transport system component
LVDIQRDVLVRFTFNSANDTNPVWSPDGARIVFSSNRKAVSDLYVKRSNGAGPEQLLLETSVDSKSPADWSADGRVLLYTTGSDIWALPLTDDLKPFPVLKTPFQAHGAQFSPDGKWIAYASNESGRFEIFVQPFPPGPGKWQISNSGGTQPRWRRDGKELFYIAPNNALMAAPYKITPDGRSIESGPPRILFSTRMVRESAPNGAHYVVSSDGLRFLVDTVVEEPTPQITIIRNWKPRS